MEPRRNPRLHQPMRPPRQVMRLARMGASFATRLSFMRVLLRRLASEAWTFERQFDLDDNGFGQALITAKAPGRTYTLVIFSHYLDPEQRSDRVIAEAWDSTFSLFDGVPTAADIARLEANAPRQEAGRFRDSELVLARANKSVRLFDYIADCLASGHQPSVAEVANVGYLMRTTAVYGSGKFGCADRERIAGRPETHGAFQVEMLAVYMFRWFTLGLVEHIAKVKGGKKAVKLNETLAQYLGVGNATGLGMAPFLVRHPLLIDHWVQAREQALARVRGLGSVTPEAWSKFLATLASAEQQIIDWRVDDAIQADRIAILRTECADFCGRVDDLVKQARYPWDALYCYAEQHYGIETQELIAALLLEPQGALVDDLADQMAAPPPPPIDPAMTISGVQAILDDRYVWVWDFDFTDPAAQARFWYYSEEKLEPRFGFRHREPGGDLEMPLAIARDVQALSRDLAHWPEATKLAAFLLRFPQHRQTIRRVQLSAHAPYSEVQDNLIAEGTRPIDLLRFKLAFFGASKFDPKSDLWTRITLYQGAPQPSELTPQSADDWTFTARPS